MSEYRRFVSYLYEYRKGRKENNCGFVKVEIRNGACRIRLRLQPSGCADPLQVYGFVRDRQEILGIPLGTAQAQSGACEFQAGYPAAAVGGTSYSIRDVRGIWLQSADGQNYITVWDDEPVAAERFRVLPEKTAEQEPAREQAVAAGQMRAETEAGAQETAAGQTHAEAETGAQEAAAEQTRAEAEEDAQETAAGQTHAETETGAQEAAAGQEQTDAQAAGAEQICTEAETIAPETAAEQEQTDAQAAGAGQTCAEAETIAPEIAAEHARAETQAAAAEQVQSAGWDSARSARPSGSLYQRWEQFLNHYPQVRPFADDEITQCIMIALKDLSFLQSGEWHFGRNTFVRQAYARYHHLLLGCHRSGRFVLAVPGTGRDPQEKQMARMYGFPYFKDSAEPQEVGCVRAADEQSSASDRQGSAVNGQGSPALTGYWYHFLNEACPADL